jgi:3-hydroxy acid dehydrogenase / malonic semialdehyde reductase
MPTTRDKLILVTGASSGIGAACARRFAAEGARLVLWARREDRLAALADELGQRHGTDVRTAAVDVRDRAVVFAAAEDLIRAAGAPDVLVNNAGLAAGLARFHEGDPDDWDRMLDTNVRGLLNVTRAFLPAMVERGSGHVVNIGSTAGHQVYPMGNVYNATKFAVRALNEGLSVDLLGTPIRVSGVDPGFVETEFARVRFRGDEERAAGVYRGFRPLAADDVADAVAYVVNAPAHVNVFDLVLMPTAQRSSYLVHRQE